MSFIKKMFSSTNSIKKVQKYSEFKPCVPYWKIRNIKENIAYIIPLSEKFKERPSRIQTTPIVSYDEKTGRIETENSIYLPYVEESLRPKKTPLHDIEFDDILNQEVVISEGIDFDFTGDYLKKFEESDHNAEILAQELGRVINNENQIIVVDDEIIL